MTSYTQTLAITLSKRSIKSDDRLFVFYTKDFGKISAIAAGASKIKSKLAGHLEPFGIVRLNLAKGYQANKVIGAVIEKKFPSIHNDLRFVLIARSCLKLIEVHVKENHPDEKIYNLIVAVLSIFKANMEKDKLDIIRPIFIFKFIKILGYEPELTNCLQCKKKILSGDKNLFSYMRGGLLCPDCIEAAESDIKIPDNLIKVMRLTLKLPIHQVLSVKISTMLVRDFQQIAEKFLQYRL